MGDARAEWAHGEGDHVHGPAPHGAGEELELGVRVCAGHAELRERRAGGAGQESFRTVGAGAPDDEAHRELVAGGELGGTRLEPVPRARRVCRARGQPFPPRVS